MNKARIATDTPPKYYVFWALALDMGAIALSIIIGSWGLIIKNLWLQIPMEVISIVVDLVALWWAGQIIIAITKTQREPTNSKVEDQPNAKQS